MLNIGDARLPILTRVCYLGQSIGSLKKRTSPVLSLRSRDSIQNIGEFHSLYNHIHPLDMEMRVHR
jgi:hypothetical protein